MKKWTLTLVYHQLSYLKLFITYFRLIFQDIYTGEVPGVQENYKLQSSTKNIYSVQSSQKKLTFKNEFLLTLMRLCLGLLNEDLPDRFGISTTICLNIFKTWIRFLAQTLGKLAAWLLKLNMEYMPKTFCKAGHSRLREVIDCSEIFIERPKSVNVQAAMWSDYKLHSTVKFLIGISPTRFVMFLNFKLWKESIEERNDANYWENARSQMFIYGRAIKDYWLQFCHLKRFVNFY